VVLGQGDTAAEALADVTSAIRFQGETFERDVLDVEAPVIDAFVTEALVATS